MKGKSRLLNSTAPMSHRAVPSLLPSTFRGKPRWSVCKSAPGLSRQPLGLPASIAGLPATRACVWVGPPLFFKGPRICASETLGTISVGPGVKPVTPALPLVPNKLKLFAVTMSRFSISGAKGAWLPAIKLLLSVSIPCRNNRIVAVLGVRYATARLARLPEMVLFADRKVRCRRIALVLTPPPPRIGRIAGDGAVRNGEGADY